MNKLISIAIFFAFTLSLFAQTAPPAKINFQAAVRNSTGQPLASKTIAVQFKIKSGSATGLDELVETYTGVTTNSFGLFNIAIGTQSIAAGGTTLDQLAWGSKDYFLVVSVDTNNTTSSFNVISSQQLITVPYAFHARTADSLVNFSLQNDAWTTKGNSISVGQYIGTNNTQDFIVKTSGVERMRVFANGSVSFPDASNVITAKNNAVFGLSNNINNNAQLNFVAGSNNKFVGNAGSNNIILGGDNTFNNGASNSTIIGNDAHMYHRGSLLLKDDLSPALFSTNDDQFSARFKGGYRFFVDSLNFTTYTPSGNWGINDISPNSTLYLAGSQGFKLYNLVSSVTLDDKQSLIFVKNSGQTITLPPAGPAAGRVYIIKCPGSLSYTIKSSGTEQIDGTFSNTTWSQSIMVFSDGSGWQTLRFQ